MRTCLRCILVVLDCLEEIAIAVGIKKYIDAVVCLYSMFLYTRLISV